MRRLLWTLLVLVVLALALDRGGDLVAEKVVASRLQDEQGLDDEPVVSIGGFPFLDQFAAGHYDDVAVVARAVPVPGTGLSLSQVRLTFKDVDTNRDFTRFSAARASATAVVPYSELGDELGIKAAYAGDGRVRVQKTFEVFGQSVDAEATVDATYERGSLTLGDFDLGDSLPAGIADQLRDAADNALQLDDLPFDVTVQSVSATSDGLHLRLRGTDLTYES